MWRQANSEPTLSIMSPLTQVEIYGVDDGWLHFNKSIAYSQSELSQKYGTMSRGLQNNWHLKSDNYSYVTKLFTWTYLYTLKFILLQNFKMHIISGNKMPTRCNRGFYCRSYCLLNMFRAPLWPSSGAQEYYTVVATCGISCCGFSSSWSGVELRVMCPVCRMLQHPANRTHNPQLWA